MLSRIFPRQIDEYRGYQLAVWLLALFLLVKTFASVNAIGLNPLWSNRDVLRGVEKVPLDTFSTEGASAAMVLFAWWGVTALVFTVLGFIAVVRYRAMVPLVYLLMAINHIGQQVLADTSPLVRMLGAGEPRPLIVIAVLLIGFGMSLTTPRGLEGGRLNKRDRT
ncbi:MAG: hypothetical protein JNL06_10040 [Alphaproteobacteria bacterium]|nr:hypothetical protein [Alphaproteobacteria bacterium]